MEEYFWAQNLTTTLLNFFWTTKMKNSFYFSAYFEAYTPTLALVSFEQVLE